MNQSERYNVRISISVHNSDPRSMLVMTDLNFRGSTLGDLAAQISTTNELITVRALQAIADADAADIETVDLD